MVLNCIALYTEEDIILALVLGETNQRTSSLSKSYCLMHMAGVERGVAL